MGQALIHFKNLSIATSKWVKPPGAFCKGPTRSNPHTVNGHVMGICLQSVSREVCLPGIELATLVGPHDVSGVGHCGGPVEALPKRVAHEGARRGMVTADSSVDVPDQLLALGDGDATLQNAQGATLVQFIVDQNKGLGPPGDTPCLSTV